MTQDKTKLAIYLDHRAALVEYATPIVGCRARAEDVVQESYLRFTGRSGDVDAPRQPVAYLYRVVRNLAVDCLRHLSREGEPVADEVWDQMPAPVATPESEALYRDELRVLAGALEELPDRTRTVFEMHRLGGLTQQQIARQLGISVGLVNHLVDDALTHCAERMGRRSR
ncbi:MAG: sigma-70 family RNA polymerase sigma factor [Telmatospirillum sp.]|nr:sigma-70 family RNA polymerase sigma factor [Telmatospirillum sp.]